jgi:ribonuclease D
MPHASWGRKKPEHPRNHDERKFVFMKNDWIWVDNQEKLGLARDGLRGSSFIGIDTEYDSFRYFREKLCLIQINNGSTAYLFDPFENLDISFLGDIFRNPETVKIVHSGDNDIRILNRDYGFQFKNVFDTQRAASVLGLTHLSLSRVVYHYLGVTLDKPKKVQRSQWETRPLTKEQLIYAVEDTSYLIDLHHRLVNRLKIEGLEEKAHEIFSELEAVRWKEKTLDPDGYLKIRGCRGLNENQQKRLKALFRWRFQKARETNRARFMILSDTNLLNLSKKKMSTLDSLTKSCVLPPGKLKESGPAILKALNQET